MLISARPNILQVALSYRKSNEATHLHVLLGQTVLWHPERAIK